MNTLLEIVNEALENPEPNNMFKALTAVKEALENGNITE